MNLLFPVDFYEVTTSVPPLEKGVRGIFINSALAIK